MTISLSNLNAGFYAGDKGSTGGAGSKGDKGDSGQKGELGSKGDKGDVEAQGNKGEKGDLGSKGEQGAFGGASFEFIYTNLTSNTEPGNGLLRFNNASLSSATLLFIDQEDGSGANTYGYLQAIDDSTSSVKGTFTITEVANNDNFAYFSITGTHGHYTHYFELPIIFLTGPASFSNNTPVAITFARTGDAEIKVLLERKVKKEKKQPLHKPLVLLLTYNLVLLG